MLPSGSESPGRPAGKKLDISIDEWDNLTAEALFDTVRIGGNQTATKVFISWSGDLSRKLGEALRDWLPAALQYVQPYFSPEDIEKGAKWNTEIAKELESTDVGVICLTQSNIEKPWILFESGALSKSIDKSRVCTLLFDLEPADVTGPLTSFQATRFQKADFKRLVATINKAAGDAKLDAHVLDSVFDMWWPKLEAEVKKILDSHDGAEDGVRRSDRDILEEILELSRMKSTRRMSAVSAEPALEDLIEVVVDTLEVFGEFDPTLAIDLYRRFDRPLRYLCLGTRAIDAYERFHSFRARYDDVATRPHFSRVDADPSEDDG